MSDTTDFEGKMAELRRLEEAVSRSDGDGLVARWESGRQLLTLRQGKQLKRGVMVTLVSEFGVHRSELTARMKLATKFSSEPERANAISTFKSWFAIKQKALTTSRAAQPSRTSKARRAIAMLDNLDPEGLTRSEIATLEASVQRLKDGFTMLKNVA